MEFKFKVPSMTLAQASALYNVIVAICDAIGLDVVGGYNVQVEQEEDTAGTTTENG